MHTHLGPEFPRVTSCNGCLVLPLAASRVRSFLTAPLRPSTPTASPAARRPDGGEQGLVPCSLSSCTETRRRRAARSHIATSRASDPMNAGVAVATAPNDRRLLQMAFE